MLLIQVLVDQAIVVIIRLCRTDAPAPVRDEREAVAYGKIVIGIVAIFRLEVIVILDLIQPPFKVFSTTVELTNLAILFPFVTIYF